MKKQFGRNLFNNAVKTAAIVLAFCVAFTFAMTSLGQSPSVVLAANAASTKKTYYVSGSSGSDSNAGTSSKPWKTIQKAVNSAANGSIIYVKAGTYNQSVTISRNASSKATITLINYAKDAVTINGGGSPAIVVSGAGSKYWIVQGFTLKSSGDKTIDFTSWGCNGDCAGSDHMTFKGNKIKGAVGIYGAYTLFTGNDVDGSSNNGNGGNGVQDEFGASHNNTYSNNNIHNFSIRGIWSMQRTHDNVFSGNNIHDITDSEAMCLDLDGYGSVEYRQKATGNTISNCGLGIQLENVYASTVSGNKISNTKKLGIALINYGPTIAASGNTKCTVGGDKNQYGDTNHDNNCEGDITKDIVESNTITNSAGQEGGAIVLWHVGGVSILKNTIKSSAVKTAIYVDSSKYCPKTVISGNKVS